MSECVSLAGPGRPRSTCNRWTALGTERTECDGLAAGPCQQLRGRRQRDLDLVHLLRSLWLKRPFPLHLPDKGQRHTAGSEHWKPAQAGKAWLAVGCRSQAEELGLDPSRGKAGEDF